MLKIIRCVLYGLAISTGVAGLFVGGVPIAKYALERFRDSEYGYYYETNFLFSPEVIFLLSLILLIFVHIGLVVGKGIHVAGPTKSDSSAKPARIRLHRLAKIPRRPRRLEKSRRLKRKPLTRS